jgi:hypothetical protein
LHGEKCVETHGQKERFHLLLGNEGHPMFLLSSDFCAQVISTK